MNYSRRKFIRVAGMASAATPLFAAATPLEHVNNSVKPSATIAGYSEEENHKVNNLEIERAGTASPDHITCYVDPVGGNDKNSGESPADAIKTIAKAQDLTGDITEIIIISSGDFRESINIRRKKTQKRLKIKTVPGQTARVLAGTWLHEGNCAHVEGSIYRCNNIQSFAKGDKFQIFQHDVDDVNTLIPEEERHPLQKGKKYRCDSTVINRTTSLELVKASSSGNPLFFYDEADSTLHFRIVDGTNLKDNPVVIPRGNTIFGNDNSVHLELENVEFLYGPVIVRNCSGAKLVDCAAKYTEGGGAFSYNMSVGIEFVRCEAARAFTDRGNGDGFNGHSSTTGEALAKHTTATFIDCWAHDCMDDGYSDHERCESTFLGGLFEYCGKGALTPAYGAHDTFIGCLCRKSRYGIGLVGGAAEAEGGVGSQAIAYNCVCADNNRNFYVDGTSVSQLTGINSMILVNCISLRGGEHGYIAGKYGKMVLHNCTDKDSTVVKSGTVISENGVMVV